MILHQYDETPCPGMNCGSTDGKHSKECIAEHTAAAAGGDFVKWQRITSDDAVMGCDIATGKRVIAIHEDGGEIAIGPIMKWIDGEGIQQFGIPGSMFIKRVTHYLTRIAPPVPNK